ncbi:UDP-N-acetylmuramate--L-alanine ligase [Herbiconiux sp. L3-i23]|uniref:UDP-N-acetylmuramate--L-alanine ligase n=1 Tax=Herbiconiux sp. L3-i23 TaxID=2905871 RepID=UPI00204B05AF|nr:UDP-N-acetylmuramate--L-alanine ligase [Herbiconiux sp. L3-i23]BDI22405.1 UDP-N-acetylmuramate--L-alanine ligase [Herbiconiux sp. L3-i23]
MPIKPDLTLTLPDDPGALHFVGIGGSGMSGIARMFLQEGHTVSGSDRDEGPYLQALRDLGATITVGHDAANVKDADTLVVTSALWEDNPEYVAARERGIPVLHRSQALKWLTLGKRVVSVAGAHGKTTSAGMIITALLELDADPNFVNGGIISKVGTSAARGESDLFVLEADESDGSFLLYDTAIALITNVDSDHLDHYGSIGAFDAAFGIFADRASELVVLSSDDSGTQRIRELIENKNLVTFGEADDADVRVTDIDAGERVSFSVTWKGETHPVSLGVAGRHNAINATGAFAVLVGLGYAPADVARALGAFGGTKRRFEYKGERRGVRVFDDYAHHPSEAAAALATARSVVGEGRIIAVHQPHLFSRTRLMSPQFASVYEELADHTIVLDVDGAREDPVPGVSGELVSAEFDDQSKVDFLPDWADAASRVAEIAREGDIVMTLSCGSVYRIVPQLLDALDGEPAADSASGGGAG